MEIISTLKGIAAKVKAVAIKAFEVIKKHYVILSAILAVGCYAFAGNYTSNPETAMWIDLASRVFALIFVSYFAWHGGKKAIKWFKDRFGS